MGKYDDIIDGESSPETLPAQSKYGDIIEADTAEQKPSKYADIVEEAIPTTAHVTIDPQPFKPVVAETSKMDKPPSTADSVVKRSEAVPTKAPIVLPTDPRAVAAMERARAARNEEAEAFQRKLLGLPPANETPEDTRLRKLRTLETARRYGDMYAARAVLSDLQKTDPDTYRQIIKAGQQDKFISKAAGAAALGAAAGIVAPARAVLFAAAGTNVKPVTADAGQRIAPLVDSIAEIPYSKDLPAPDFLAFEGMPGLDSEDLWNTVRKSWLGYRTSSAVSKAEATQHPGDVAAYMSLRDKRDRVPPSRYELAAQKAQQTGSIAPIAAEFAPGQLMNTLMALNLQSTAMFVPSMIEHAPEAIAAGGLGALNANTILTFMASRSMEGAGMMEQVLQERMKTAGADPNDPEQVLAILGEPQTREIMHQQANAKGIPIALVDASLNRLAPVFAISQTAKRAARVKNTVKMAVVEGVGSGIGEVAGELTAGEDLSPADIIAEFFGDGTKTLYDLASASITDPRGAKAKVLQDIRATADPEERAKKLDEAGYKNAAARVRFYADAEKTAYEKATAAEADIIAKGIPPEIAGMFGDAIRAYGTAKDKPSTEKAQALRQAAEDAYRTWLEQETQANQRPDATPPPVPGQPPAPTTPPASAQPGADVNENPLQKAQREQQEGMAEVRTAILEIDPAIEVRQSLPGRDLEVDRKGRYIAASPELVKALKSDYGSEWKRALRLAIQEERLHQKHIAERGENAEKIFAEEWRSATPEERTAVKDAYGDNSGYSLNPITGKLERQEMDDSQWGAELARMREQAISGEITESVHPSRKEKASKAISLFNGKPESAIREAVPTEIPLKTPAIDLDQQDAQTQAPTSEATSTAQGGPVPGERKAPVEAQTPDDIRTAEKVIDQNATPAQKEAENFKQAHVRVQGYDLTLETAKGSTRTAADGSWSVPNFPASYGKIKGSKGRDWTADKPQQLDAYVGDNPASDRVFVIDQKNPKTGEFDEHKVMLGFNTEAEARDAYYRAFSDGSGPLRLLAITPTTKESLNTFVTLGNVSEDYRAMPYDTFSIGRKPPAPTARQMEGVPTTVPAAGTGKPPVQTDVTPSGEVLSPPAAQSPTTMKGGTDVRIDTVRQPSVTEAVEQSPPPDQARIVEGVPTEAPKPKQEIRNEVPEEKQQADVVPVQPRLDEEAGAVPREGRQVREEKVAAQTEQRQDNAGIVPRGTIPDWDLFREDLEDRLDADSPARDNGRRNYELMETAQRFVDYAQKQPDGSDLSKLAAEFSKLDEASDSQLRKLRRAVKDLLPRESPARGEMSPEQAAAMLGDSGMDPLTRDTDQAAWAERNPKSAAVLRAMVESAAKDAGYTIGPVYHGTPTGGFNTFKKGEGDTPFGRVQRRPGISFHYDRKLAEVYAKDKEPLSREDAPIPEVKEVYLRAAKIWDYENQDHMKMAVDAIKAHPEFDSWMLEELDNGDWEIIESGPVQKAIKGSGFDAFFSNDHPGKAIQVYKSSQAKSADLATFRDDGTPYAVEKRFQADSNDIRESPSRMDTDTLRSMRRKVDRLYSTGRGSEAENLDARIEDLIERTSTDAEATAVESGGDANDLEYDPSMDPQELSIEEQLRVLYDDYAIDQNGLLRADYPTLGAYIRSALNGEGPWIIKDGVSDEQLEAGAQDAVLAHQQRRARLAGQPLMSPSRATKRIGGQYNAFAEYMDDIGPIFVPYLMTKAEGRRGQIVINSKRFPNHKDEYLSIIDFMMTMQADIDAEQDPARKRVMRATWNSWFTNKPSDVLSTKPMIDEVKDGFVSFVDPEGERVASDADYDFMMELERAWKARTAGNTQTEEDLYDKAEEMLAIIEMRPGVGERWRNDPDAQKIGRSEDNPYQYQGIEVYKDGAGTWHVKMPNRGWLTLVKGREAYNRLSRFYEALENDIYSDRPLDEENTDEAPVSEQPYVAPITGNDDINASPERASATLYAERDDAGAEADASDWTQAEPDADFKADAALRAGRPTTREAITAAASIKEVYRRAGIQTDRLESVRPSLPMLENEAWTPAFIMAGLAGHKLVPVRWNLRTNGVVYDDTIYVSDRSDMPVMTTAGHEILHLWDQKYGDTPRGIALRQALDELAPADRLNAYRKELGRNHRLPSGMTTAQRERWLREELYADLLGESVTKQSFWERLAEISTDAFRSLYRMLGRIVSRMMGVDPAYSTDPYFTDLVKARDIAAEIYQTMVQDGTISEATGTERMSPARQTSAVTPEQDAEYMAAVERGDMETAQRMVDEASKKAGYATRVYHGTDAERTELQGGTFTTDNAREAADYAEMAAIKGKENDLADTLYEIMDEEGAESLTDLSLSTLKTIAEDNGVDLKDVQGFVHSLNANLGKVLDLTEMGSTISLKDDWNTLHKMGLVTDAWDDIDEEFQHEMHADYDGMAIYRLFEKEGVYDAAFKQGYDTVRFEDQGMEGKSTHTSYITKDAAQLKSADPVTRDDQGNVIPLSQRFNQQSQDIRESPSRKNDEYSLAGPTVDGRTVRDGSVPNTGSIASSLTKWTVLKGIREVPMSDFEFTGRHYSVSGQNRIDNLAEEIAESGEITPLIVVVESRGPYVLEGATRAEALYKLGAKSFPALVVIDESDDIRESPARKDATENNYLDMVKEAYNAPPPGWRTHRLSMREMNDATIEEWYKEALGYPHHYEKIPDFIQETMAAAKDVMRGYESFPELAADILRDEKWIGPEGQLQRMALALIVHNTYREAAFEARRENRKEDEKFIVEQALQMNQFLNAMNLSMGRTINLNKANRNTYSNPADIDAWYNRTVMKIAETMTTEQERKALEDALKVGSEAADERDAQIASIVAELTTLQQAYKEQGDKYAALLTRKNLEATNFIRRRQEQKDWQTGEIAQAIIQEGRDARKKAREGVIASLDALGASMGLRMSPERTRVEIPPSLPLNVYEALVQAVYDGLAEGEISLIEGSSGQDVAFLQNLVGAERYEAMVSGQSYEIITEAKLRFAEAMQRHEAKRGKKRRKGEPDMRAALAFEDSELGQQMKKNEALRNLVGPIQQHLRDDAANPLTPQEQESAVTKIAHDLDEAEVDMNDLLKERGIVTGSFLGPLFTAAGNISDAEANARYERIQKRNEDAYRAWKAQQENIKPADVVLPTDETEEISIASLLPPELADKMAGLPLFRASRGNKTWTQAEIDAMWSKPVGDAMKPSSLDLIRTTMTEQEFQGFIKQKFGDLFAENINAAGEPAPRSTDILGTPVTKLLNPAIIGRTIRQQIRDLQTTAQSILTSHYTTKDRLKANLIAKLRDGLNLSPYQAIVLANEVDGIMKGFYARERLKAAKRFKAIFDSTETGGRNKKALHDLLAMINAGIFEDRALIKTWANAVGATHMTDADYETMLGYAPKIKEAHFDFEASERINELFQFVHSKTPARAGEILRWFIYTNLLSGYKDDVRNLVYSTVSTLDMMVTLAGKDPKRLAAAMYAAVANRSIHGGLTEAAAAMAGNPVAKHIGALDISRDFVPTTDSKNPIKRSLVYLLRKYAQTATLISLRPLGAMDMLITKQSQDVVMHVLATAQMTESGMSERAARRKATELVYGTRAARKQWWKDAKDAYPTTGLTGKAKAAQILRQHRAFEESRMRQIDGDLRAKGLEWASIGMSNNVPEGLTGEAYRAVMSLTQSINGKYGPVGKYAAQAHSLFMLIAANIINADLSMFPIWIFGRKPKSFRRDTPAHQKSFYRRREITGHALIALVYALDWWAETPSEDDDEDEKKERKVTPPFACYGFGPNDPTERAAWIDSGGRPFSLRLPINIPRVGKKGDLLDYRQMAPYSFVLAAAGVLADVRRGWIKIKDPTIVDQITYVATGVIRAIAGSTFLTTYAKTFDLIGGSSYAENIADVAAQAIGNAVHMLTPQSALIKQLNELFTSTVYQDDVMADGTPTSGWRKFAAYTLRNMPFADHWLKPRINALGDIVDKEKVGIFVNEWAPNPVYNWLMKEDLTHVVMRGPSVSTRIGDKDDGHNDPNTGRLDPNDHYNLTVYSGQAIKAAITAELAKAKPAWGTTPEQKEKWLEDTRSKALEDAKKKIIRGE